MSESFEVLAQLGELRGDEMRTPDDVAEMVRLQALGWSERQIAAELEINRRTVRRYLATAGWVRYRRPRRGKKLDGLEDWLAERFRRHHGNAAVVRQDLERERGLAVSLRTIERAVAGWRRELRAEARATVRFETPPGHQLQIDFGETRVMVGTAPVLVYLFVATLGYSRRVFVRAFGHERQSAWLDGLEAAFQHFGGVPQEVLLDNARALVDRHDLATREVVFNERLHGFSRYWGFRPRACAPYRARTKGKVERGVGYVKHNAIAGRAFASWAELEGHLAWWVREIADRREHGTTGEAPLDRFDRDEAAALRPLNGRPPFRQQRELIRRVQSDSSIELDTNSYSVPWRLIGETVQVMVAGGRVSVRRGGREVAAHEETGGRHQRISDPIHLAGIGRPQPGGTVAVGGGPERPLAAAPELLRPLSEYEQAVGGGW
jgi:transposase